MIENLHGPFLLYLLGAFTLGALPFGKLIARIAAGLDITHHGSGNIGAANVARTIGVKWGLLTLVLDALKGFLPVFFFSDLFSGGPLGPSLGGLCALLGHQFSPFLKFRGGKGVGTALGLYLAVAPGPCLLAMALFAIVVYFSNFVSLGSMISACAIPLLLLMWGRSAGIVLIACAMAILVCLKHRDNLGRLLKGQERKWRAGKAQDNRSSRRSSSSSE
ncbi:MAG: glycerol-3-phosphate 1-O-acyltransferase PlsY [Deltaproteobacteria bacterium]|nr:glycerol-3-phosphate 1-O-acyltransferase PlsY [Deltaproteobacteria bacterium]